MIFCGMMRGNCYDGVFGGRGATGQIETLFVHFSLNILKFIAILNIFFSTFKIRYFLC